LVLEIARRYIVDAGISEDIRPNILIGLEIPTALAYHNPQLSFVIHAGRDFRPDDRAVWIEQGRRRLQKDQRLRRDIMTKFGSMFTIVSSDANNLRRLDWR
jgi:hypothetical protein